MEWVKVLAFEYPAKDRNDLPIMHIVTCKWRSDGVCYFTQSKRSPDNAAQSEMWAKHDEWRWDRYLNEKTDTEPSTEKEFQKAFLMNMFSQFGTQIDTGFSVDPEVQREVLADPSIVELKRLAAIHGPIYGE